MNGLNMGLPWHTWVQKTVHGVKTHWVSGKEKVPGTAISKEYWTDSILGYYYWFLWNGFNCKQCFLLQIL